MCRNAESNYLSFNRNRIYLCPKGPLRAVLYCKFVKLSDSLNVCLHVCSLTTNLTLVFVHLCCGKTPYSRMNSSSSHK